MKRLAVLLPLLMSSGVYAVEVSPFIINGTEARVTDYPTFSSLYFDNGRLYGNYCGSTMINDEYVLTAAHCLYRKFDYMLHTWVVPQVRDQSLYLDDVYIRVRAVEFYLHQDYVHSESAKWVNDIAIIKVARPLGYGDLSNHLNVSENNSYVSLNGAESFIAIGHGLVNGELKSNGKLQETSLELLNRSSCGTLDSQLCFDGPVDDGYRSSTCQGDSGGPVYASLGEGNGYKQIGITSFGPEPCGNVNPRVPYTSVFTEIYDYTPWINSVISGGEEPSYYVETEGDTRRLIDNYTSETKTSSSYSSSSGGSLGWLSLLTLGFYGLRKKRAN